MDTEGDYVVSKQEFLEWATHNGMSEAEAMGIFQEINFGKRFTMAHILHFIDVSTIALMNAQFQAMDDHRDRQLTKDEFENFFLKGGNSKSTTSGLWARLDSSHNGKVNFREWKAWAEDVLKLEVLDAIFKSVTIDDELAEEPEPEPDVPPSIPAPLPQPHAEAVSPDTSYYSNLIQQRGSRAPNVRVAMATMKAGSASNEIKALFRSMDTEGDYVVSKQEFLEWATHHGMSEAEAMVIFQEINFGKRFTTSHLTHFIDVATIALMTAQFKEMDVDHDRQLTKDDVENFFSKSGNSKRTTSSLWNRLDVSHNGKVNFKEWKAWAQQILELEVLDAIFHKEA